MILAGFYVLAALFAFAFVGGSAAVIGLVCNGLLATWDWVRK